MGDGGPTVHRSCTPIVDGRYNRDSDQSPAETIIELLAKAAGVDTVELPSLYEYVDTDMLNTLFHHTQAANTEALISFEVDNWVIFARSDGHIRICDSTKPADPTPVFEGEPA